MKIVINTAHQRFGGAIQVALSFIYECRRFQENQYHIWVGPGVGKSLKKEEFGDNFAFYELDFGLIDFRTIKGIQKSLAILESRIDPDVIISTSGPTYFHSVKPQIIGFNLGLYIYPESPYLQQLSLMSRIRLYTRKKIHYYFFKRDASAYVVQTNDVNQRVRKALRKDEVYTVTNTNSTFFLNQPAFPQRLPEREKGEVRLLTLSAYYPHKNLEIIPNIVVELRKRGINYIKFVLTLKKEDFEKRIVKDKNIVNLEVIRPEECPSLYKECDVMFLPTLVECFSASYPEAMVMQLPIITTDLGFAHSICGDAALFYKPRDVKSAADAIMQLINNDELYTSLIQKGMRRLGTFDTPQSRAEKYLKLCEKFAAI